MLSRHLTSGMDLELRHLRLMRASLVDGSLTRAGVRLHLSQSALSHQLADLEARLGVRLFHRTGKRLTHTDAGEQLLAMCGDLLDRIEQAELAVRALAGR